MFVAMIFLGMSIYLVWLARSPETLRQEDAADTAQGLKIGALTLAALGIPWMVGSIAMWRGRVWGWWLTFLIALGMSSILIYSVIDDGWHALELDDATVTAVFLVFPLLLLLPQVRKYCRKTQSLEPVATQRMPQPTS
jgi:hypothetical protein